MAAEPAAIAELMGGKEVLGREVRTLADLERLVTEGLPRAALEHVAEHVFPEPARRRALIHSVVPESTFRRRVRLTPVESERAERLARVMAEVYRLWRDKADTREFVTRPHPLLGGRSPLQAAMTNLGLREVEQLLAKIEFGLPV